MGRVYRAQQPSLDRTVAIKVLGLREFRGFLQPVERAVMKRAKEAEAIRQERLIYSQIDYRLVKLLDHGASRSGRPCLVRRAYQHLEHDWTNADDPLLGLFQLKYDHVDPIDPAALRARV